MGKRKRLHAWLDMLFMDHGVIRYFYSNFHQVDATPGREIYRSSQPLPHQVARWGRIGVRTIVNLRGGRHFGSYPLEVEAAARAGITLEEIKFRSRSLPDRESLEAFAAMLKRVEYPIVYHCKAGADRASLACALHILLEDNDLARARSQLALKYGHIKGAKTGILDAFIDAYAEQGHARGQSVMDWVRDTYDPEAIAAAFRPNMLGSLLADGLLNRE